VKKLLPALCMILVGCGPASLLHRHDDVALYQIGAAKVEDRRAQLKLRFDVAPEWRETIQYLDMNTLPDMASESHKQPMWIPDYQIIVAPAEGESYQIRRNRVFPGKTEGAPWGTLPGIFKGVCLIDGWLDEDGEPMSNRVYFRWGGKQGGEVVDLYGDGMLYVLEFWTPGHPDNPRPGRACLRMTVSDNIWYWLGPE
jgi:hypothetical protein